MLLDAARHVELAGHIEAELPGLDHATAEPPDRRAQVAQVDSSSRPRPVEALGCKRDPARFGG